MKLKTILLLVAVGICCCDKTDFLSPDHSVLISNKWAAKEVYADGALTDLFDGLVVGFSPNTYSTNLTRNEVWPAFGGYAFENKNSRILLRDDNNELLIATLDESQLILVFKFIDANVANARSAPVEYTFVFEAQADSD